MSKKLFVVDVDIETFQMCVLAESRADATRIALENASSEFSNIDSGWIAAVSCEPRSVDDLPEEWLGGVLPYSDGPEQELCETYVAP